jgi:type IV pilus assembly protein PilX
MIDDAHERQRRSRPSQASGIALPIVLMFMLVITIVAGVGVRRIIVGEGATRRQLDYEAARNAAESALRDGERDLFTLAKVNSAVCDRTMNRPLGTAIKPPFWGADCPEGQCYVRAEYLSSSNMTTAANPQPWWPDAKNGKWGNNVSVPASCTFKGGVPIGTFTGASKVSGVARQPEYIIEYIERVDDPILRVTARGFGADINTEVVLQAYIRASVE